METNALTLLLLPVSLLTLAFQYLAIIRLYNQDKAMNAEEAENEKKGEAEDKCFLKEEADDNFDLAYNSDRNGP